MGRLDAKSKTGELEWKSEWAEWCSKRRQSTATSRTSTGAALVGSRIIKTQGSAFLDASETRDLTIAWASPQQFFS